MWHLLDLLFPPRSDEVLLRTISLEDFLAHLRPRLVDQTRPATTTLLPFHDPYVRAAIHEAKYHGSHFAFTLLSSALTDYLREEDNLHHAVLIQVPLSQERLRSRGYNQVLEVAKRTAQELHIELMPDLLVRTRNTTTQVSLPRHEREENMRGAFACPTRGAAHPLDPTATYLLLDDVITTGATLQAAIDALTEAGAQHVRPLALAH